MPPLPHCAICSSEFGTTISSPVSSDSIASRPPTESSANTLPVARNPLRPRWARRCDAGLLPRAAHAAARAAHLTSIYATHFRRHPGNGVSAVHARQGAALDEEEHSRRARPSLPESRICRRSHRRSRRRQRPRPPGRSARLPPEALAGGIAACRSAPAARWGSSRGAWRARRQTRHRIRDGSGAPRGPSLACCGRCRPRTTPRRSRSRNCGGWWPWRVARLASVLAAEALARPTRDSVLHFAAE
jgi:hypothetical protein